MPDLDLIKQAEQGVRDRLRFALGKDRLVLRKLANVIAYGSPKAPCPACAGHPRLHAAVARSKGVGGRDKPGYGELPGYLGLWRESPIR
jgi:hypothetical protein